MGDGVVNSDRVAASDENPPDWSRVDQALGELDKAWQSAAAPSFAHLVPPPGDPSRRLVLVELIKADIEHQWRTGWRRKVEAYLESWPELKDDPDALVELVEAECLARACLGALPTQEELRSRFPGVWRAVDLAAIRAEMRTGDARQDQTPSTAEVPLPLDPGHQFGPYKILELLGRGGMGAVYRAFDTGLDREVALKIPYVDPDTEAVVLERFLTEAKMAAQIEHPHICPVYHVDQIEGRYYIKMKLVRGGSLAERIEAGPIDARLAAQLVGKVALALDKAHRAGIVHRDIKPSNVLIDESGEPLLMDFGLARLARAPGPADRSAPAPEARPLGESPTGSTAWGISPPEPEARLTRTGCFVGTIPYMPPEQTDGREADARADLYSLGVVFYQMLTGRLPFESKPGEHPAELIERIVHDEPPRPRDLRPELDSRLEAICLKAMAKLPEDRFATAGEFAAALDEYCQALNRAAGKAKRRRRAAWITLLAAAGFLLAGVVIYLQTGEGTVELHVNEPGAIVTVDGDPIELRGAGAEITLPLGEHVLKVTKEGFRPYTGSLSIRWRGAKITVSIELESAGIERWIATDPAIGGICLSPDGKTLYVAYWENDNGSRIQAFDVVSGTLRMTVPFGNRHGHGDVVISPDGRYLFTTNYYREYISRIDLHNGNARTDLKIGGVPRSAWATGIGLSPDGQKLAVLLGDDGRSVDENNDQISIVDVAGGRFALAGEVRLNDEPFEHNLAFSQDSKFAYVLTRRRKSAGPVLYEISLTPPHGISRFLPFPGGSLQGVAVSSRLKRAFVSDAGGRKIWVIDLETLERVSSFDLERHAPGSLAMTPGEKLLVAVSPATRKLFLLDSEDGSVLARVSGVRELADDLEFSPDHRRLSVSHGSAAGGVAVIDLERVAGNRIVFASNRAGESFQIYAMDEDGKNVVRLTQNHATDISPRWSPDGRRIAFISDREGQPRIYLMRRDAKAVSLLASTDPVLEPRGVGLDWAADGEHIVFVADGNRAIRIVNVKTGQVRTLIAGPVVPGYAHHHGVCWRRTDGAILVNSQSPASGDYQDIFQIDPRSGKVKQVTHEEGASQCRAPASSPDGRRTAFVRYRDGTTPFCELIVMSADGTGPNCLQSGRDRAMSTPRWFPDGKSLTFCARKGDHDHIYKIDSDGGKLTQLTAGDYDDIEPDVCGSALLLRD